MPPKSDQDEDMTMDEILASIRRFVTENPQENPREQTQKQPPLPLNSQQSGPISSGQPLRNSNPPQAYVRPNSYPDDAPLERQPYRSERQEFSPSHHPEQHRYPQEDSPLMLNASLEEDVLELRDEIPSRSNTPGVQAVNPSQDLPQDSSERSIPQSPTESWEGLNVSHRLLEDSFVSKPVTATSMAAGKAQPKILEEEEEEAVASAQAVSSSANSFARLAQRAKALPPQAKEKWNNPQSLTLDQLIRDMTRPMLKEWIDSYLPILVEEMVAKEIKRITEHLEDTSTE